MKATKLSIIIPVFNEEETVEEVINRVARAETLGYEKEIIVVDDASNDGSERLLEDLKKNFNFILLRHSKNSGKGTAIRTALREVSGDLVLIQDADLEYNPQDYQNLLRAFDKHQTVIYGSRNISSKRRGYLHYFFGVKFLTFLVNFLFGSKLTDVYTGYKLFPSPIIKGLFLESRGFEFEAEITTKILQKGIKIKEVPVHYYPRTFKQGKKIRFRDGLIGLWTIFRNRVR